MLGSRLSQGIFSSCVVANEFYTSGMVDVAGQVEHAVGRGWVALRLARFVAASASPCSSTSSARPRAGRRGARPWAPSCSGASPSTTATTASSPASSRSPSASASSAWSVPSSSAWVRGLMGRPPARPRRGRPGRRGLRPGPWPRPGVPTATLGPPAATPATSRPRGPCRCPPPPGGRTRARSV